MSPLACLAGAPPPPRVSVFGLPETTHGLAPDACNEPHDLVSSSPPGPPRQSLQGVQSWKRPRRPRPPRSPSPRTEGDAKTLSPSTCAGADDAPRGVHDRMSSRGPAVLLPSQRAPVRASRHPRPGRQRAGDVEHQRANPQVPLAPRSRVDPPGPEPVLRAVHVRRHSAVLRPQQDAPAARRDAERSGRYRGRALCEGRAGAAVHARLRPVAGVHQPLRAEGTYHSGRRRALRHVSARRHERGGPHEHLRRGVRVAGVHRPPGGVRPRERSRERPVRSASRCSPTTSTSRTS